MVDYELLHGELADLATELSRDSDLYEGLHRLSVTAAAALGVEGAGVTLRVPGGTTEYITAADPVTLHVEQRQDELQEGACVDAIRSSQIVAVNDLNVEQPWPRFTPVLLEAGFHAAAGVPIPHEGTNIGAVNLYANAPRPWTTEEFRAARLIADLAAQHLVQNELLKSARTLAEQLQFALDSRVMIEQAKGMMAARAGMTPDAAFEVMRSYARGQRTKLHEVASAIVHGELDLLGHGARESQGSSPAVS